MDLLIEIIEIKSTKRVCSERIVYNICSNDRLIGSVGNVSVHSVRQHCHLPHLRLSSNVVISWTTHHVYCLSVCPSEANKRYEKSTLYGQLVTAGRYRPNPRPSRPLRFRSRRYMDKYSISSSSVTASVIKQLCKILIC